MQALILAAGYGRRLRPLTETLPKPLAPVANVPIVTHQLRWLAAAGVAGVTLNLHHLGDRIRSALKSAPSSPFERGAIRFSEEKKILGTGGGIRQVFEKLDTETLLVVNGDTLIDLDLEAMIAFHRERRAIATLALAQPRPGTGYGLIEVDAEQRIRNFLGLVPDPSAGLEARNFCGVHLIERSALEHMPRRRVFSISTDLYPALIREGMNVGGFPFDGYWQEIGSPELYLEANLDVLRRRVDLEPLTREPFPYRRDLVEMNPGVWIGRGMEIAPGTRLAAPILVGCDVRIESGCSIGPDVVLGDGARIGPDSRLRESVLLPQARVGRKSLIRGRVVSTEGALRDSTAKAPPPRPPAHR